MSSPLFLFAHGAGASSSSAWMQRWQQRLQGLGKVVAFDYPYMQQKRRAPDPLPKLIAAHREALLNARAGHQGPVFLIGKSMGGRVGCHVALEEKVSGVICMGYPLKGQNGAVRDEVLQKLSVPILFVQGTRDPLCPLDLLKTTRPRMTAPNELYVVESGNHSLEATQAQLKATRSKQSDVEERILAAIAKFVSEQS
ncbi:MAG TPA: alpha/beta fold hydrolase [Polyangiaceae bacterium]|nr:alpha/beta fold hydrolase [Polyangiaceae bacterium]